jgi:AraC-like DNA-binding protein
LLSALERFGAKGHKNEYDAINNAIATLSVENETIKSSLDQQREQIRESYLLKLLLGRYSRPAQNTVAFGTHEALAGKLMRVVSIKLNEDPPFSGDPGGNSRGNIEILNYSINNVFCELLANRFDYYRVNDGDSLVYLLCSPEGHTQADSELSGLLDILLDCFENELFVSLTIIVGKPVGRVELLSSAYKDVLELQDDSVSSGGNGIFYVDEAGDETAPYIPGREYYDKQLAQAVEQGDAETATAAAGALLDIILSQSSLSAPHSCHLLWHIPDLALKALTNAAQPDSAFMTRIVGKMEALAKSSDTGRFSAGIMGIVREICAFMQIQGIEQSSSVAARIAQYIDSNYADINLNINMIAGEFGMNPKTISRHFRQATSTGVLDYINKVRIGHAIQAASVQDTALEELSRGVGYTNIKTFRRAFAKIVGTTPGKYFQKSRKRVLSLP